MAKRPKNVEPPGNGKKKAGERVELVGGRFCGWRENVEQGFCGMAGGEDDDGRVIFYKYERTDLARKGARIYVFSGVQVLMEKKKT